MQRALGDGPLRARRVQRLLLVDLLMHQELGVGLNHWRLGLLGALQLLDGGLYPRPPGL